MNPEVKSLWLAALRSGQFEQGRDNLCNNGQYCCLGVLAQLHHNANPEAVILSKRGVIIERIYFNDEDAILPKATKAWAGLNGSNPDIMYNGGRTQITVLNDGGHATNGLGVPEAIMPLSFKEIADLIEVQF
jgi:hypothetical protein